MLNVTGSAEPSDDQWLAVIVVMPVGSLVATTLTGLFVGERFFCCHSRKNFGAIFCIAVVTASASFLDSLGVTAIEGAFAALNCIPAWRSEIAASL
jgi:Kef-type K+ transport system membrane component KefB